MSTKVGKMNAIEQACVEIAEKLEAAYEIKFTWWPSPVQHCWKIRAAWMDQCNIHEAIAKIPATEIYSLTDAKLLIKHKMFDLVDQLKPPMKEQKVNVAEGDGWFNIKNYSVDVPISQEDIKKPPSDAGAITYEMIEKAYKDAAPINTHGYGGLKYEGKPLKMSPLAPETVYWLSPQAGISTAGGSFYNNIITNSPLKDPNLKHDTPKPPKIYTMDELYADELSGKTTEQPVKSKTTSKEFKVILDTAKTIDEINEITIKYLKEQK